MRHLKTCLDELGVTYNLPIQPVSLQVRGGQNPFNKARRGSTSTTSNNDSHAGPVTDSRFLSPESLGNGARIGGQGYQPPSGTGQRSGLYVRTMESGG